MYKKWLSGIAKFSEITTSIIMFALFVIVLLGVISRYVFNAAFVWTEELALFLLAYLVFLSANILIRDWDNLQVTYFIAKLPQKVRFVLEYLVQILIFSFIIFILVISIKVIPKIGPTETAPALGITMVIPQMSIIIGFALMGVQMIGRLIEPLTGFFNRKGGPK